MYFVGDPGTTKSGNHLDGAEGDVEEDRGEGVEAERLDDEGAKSRNAAAWNTVENNIVRVVTLVLQGWRVIWNLRYGEHETEPEPRLGIKHGFTDMVPFPDARANAHLVHAETLNGNDFFVFFEELCFHWRVGHEEAVPVCK